MSHNLNLNNQTGNYSFFSVQEKAWHGLGKIVQEYPTSKEALEFAGLNFEVKKLPNIHELENGKIIKSKSSFYSYRTDTDEILGDRLGKDYQVVQNADAFAFFDAIVGGDGIQYETAGALGKGERIFITAKLPGYIKVGNDDLIEKYLFLTTSHDGFGSITAAFTPVRIVCANTLNAAMNNRTNAIKIRHTANAKEKLEQAHRVMGISNKLSTEIEDIFNRWSKINITDVEVKRLIQRAMVPNKEALHNLQAGNTDEISSCFRNIVDSAYTYAMNNPSQLLPTTKGTLFGAYNSITGYFQNWRTYRDQEAKVKSILLGGTGQLRAQTAFNLCSEYAKTGRNASFLN